MSDLTDLGQWCRTQAGETDRPEDERILWTALSDDIDNYLGIHDPNEPGLFDHTTTTEGATP